MEDVVQNRPGPHREEHDDLDEIRQASEQCRLQGLTGWRGAGLKKAQ